MTFIFRQGLFLFTSAFLFGACSTTSNEAVNPKCQTTNVTYEDQIKPIMERSCVSCHNEGNPSAGIRVDNFEATKDQAKNGKFYESVAHLEGAVAMPLNQAKLSDCEISTLKAWIDQGYRENKADEGEGVVGVSFAQTIQPILNASCVSCHNSGNATKGVNLSSYEQLTSTVSPIELLTWSVEGSNGILRMPTSGSLPESEIASIREWVNEGAKNN